MVCILLGLSELLRGLTMLKKIILISVVLVQALYSFAIALRTYSQYCRILNAYRLARLLKRGCHLQDNQLKEIEYLIEQVKKRETKDK